MHLGAGDASRHVRVGNAIRIAAEDLIAFVSEQRK